MFFCKSVSCPSCDKCPQCCRRSACGGPTAEFLASLGPKGFKSKGSFDPEGRVQSSIQVQTSTHQDTSDKERICQSSQEQLPAGGIAFPPSETSCGKSKSSILSGVLQQTFHCPQTKSKMAANLRSQCSQPVSQGQNLQNGNPRVHPSIPSTRRVGDIARLQRRLFSHPYQSKLKEVPPVPLSGPNLPVLGSPIWPLYSSYGVHNCGQGGETHGSGKKHSNAPVPGRMADPGKRQRYMFSGYPNPSGLVSGIGLGGEPQEIRTGAQKDFQFCKLPVRLDPRSSQTHPRKMGSSKLQNQFPPGVDQLFGKAIHVLDRPSHCDRKTGSVWTSPHETHPMSPEEPLTHSGIFGEGHTDSQVPSSPPALLVKGGKRPARPTLAPPSSRGSDIYRHIKRRLGRTFRRLY